MTTDVTVAYRGVMSGFEVNKETLMGMRHYTGMETVR